MMSHLSDVQEMVGSSSNVTANSMRNRINFVKWLMLKYTDTNVEIDADVEWNLFINRNK